MRIFNANVLQTSYKIAQTASRWKQQTKVYCLTPHLFSQSLPRREFALSVQARIKPQTTVSPNYLLGECVLCTQSEEIRRRRGGSNNKFPLCHSEEQHRCDVGIKAKPHFAMPDSHAIALNDERKFFQKIPKFR